MDDSVVNGRRGNGKLYGRQPQMGWELVPGWCNYYSLRAFYSLFLGVGAWASVLRDGKFGRVMVIK